MINNCILTILWLMMLDQYEDYYLAPPDELLILFFGGLIAVPIIIFALFLYGLSKMRKQE